MSDSPLLKPSAWRMPAASPSATTPDWVTPPRAAPPPATATLQAAPRFRLEHEHLIHGGAALGAALVVAAAVLASPGPGRSQTAAGASILALSGGDLSEKGLDALARRMSPGAALIAARFAPPPRAAIAWALPSPPGGAPDAADPALPPTPDLPTMSPDVARALNASLPFSTAPNPPARPFVLAGGDLLDQTRAVDCLTAAVYYEAALEPLEGQQAVAQVVLNRTRHPAYPKTVCGVVFQGANRSTGCQFTFTCDGSLERRPAEGLWRRAHEVAVAALGGFVMKKVGNATHYHAVYVAPYWNTSLLKVANIGAHVFYRWTGGAGQPRSFAGLYQGAEPQMMPASLSSAPPPSLDGLVAIALADPAKSAGGPAADSESATNSAAAPVAVVPPPTLVLDKPASAPALPPAKPEIKRKKPDLGWSRLPVQSSW